MIGERHRFMVEFAETLHRLNRLPLHLVIDEADEVAPQNPLPETRRMLHQVDRIVRRGRIRGFRVMLITQRPAVLHKNVLTQANTLIAMRLTAPQDRAAVAEWIKGQSGPLFLIVNHWRKAMSSRDMTESQLDSALAQHGFTYTDDSKRYVLDAETGGQHNCALERSYLTIDPVGIVKRKLTRRQLLADLLRARNATLAGRAQKRRRRIERDERFAAVLGIETPAFVYS